MDHPEIELTVGAYPFSKKPCLVLRTGAVCRILARFDSEACLQAFLACRPSYALAAVTTAALEALLKEESKENPDEH